MKIIRMTANPSGAWPPIQEGAFDAIPEGHALVPDSLDLAAFYAAVGFVVPTFSEVGETDEMPAHMAMTGYTVAQEALDAWIASHPEPDPLETAKSAKLSGLSAACNSAIVAGCDVTLPSGTSGHIEMCIRDSSSSESQTVNTQTSAASKTRIAQEEADGTLKRACLLNYHIGVADRITIQDAQTNGAFLVVSGVHEGSRTGSWKTTLEVRPA